MKNCEHAKVFTSLLQVITSYQRGLADEKVWESLGYSNKVLKADCK